MVKERVHVLQGIVPFELEDISIWLVFAQAFDKLILFIHLLIWAFSFIKLVLDQRKVIQCQLIKLGLNYELTQPQHQIQLINYSINNVLNMEDILDILLSHAAHSTLHLIHLRFCNLPLQQTLINTLNSFELQLQFSYLS